MDAKEKVLDKNQILEWYTDDVLKEERPKNVYAFAQKHDIEESEFYAHFSSLTAIESYFFSSLFQATVKTLNETEGYAAFTARDKWLSFYYTFFENLKLNRSFVIYALGKHNWDDLKKLKDLRTSFLEFAQEIEVEKIDFKQKDINKIQDKMMGETAWLHLLGTLKFWLKDESPNFEKTDVFIEKSVNAGMELTNIHAFKHVADFGKFIFKEFKPFK